MHDTLASLTTFATKHPLMMSALAILSVFAALPGGSACFAAEGTEKKILVAYFSHSGKTRPTLPDFSWEALQTQDS